MAYTLEQLRQMGAQPVSAQPAQTQGYTFEELQKLGASPVEQKKPGIVRQIAGSITRPFERLGATALQKGGGAVAFGIDRLTPNALTGGKDVYSSMQDAISRTPTGFDKVSATRALTGETPQPVRNVRDLVGTSLEAASNVLPVAKAPALFGNIVKGQIGRAALGGGITAGTAGFVGGTGRGLQEDGTVTEALERGLTEGAIAAPIGVGIGGLGAGLVRSPQIAQQTKQAALSTRDATRSLVEDVIALPRRTAANFADKKAEEAIIKTLPTKTAQRAARDGVKIADINRLTNLKGKDPSIYKPLIEDVKNFSAGVSNKDPILQVGKPLAQSIRAAENKRLQVGKELGEVAKNLGTVTRPEIENAVVNKLTKTPGLDGLRVNNGVLDFSDTTLLSTLSNKDQEAIQEAFSNAVRLNTGRQAHLFRQELFEILGGKKRALTAMTDTQEKAFEAIRDGLSDVLETKNPQYKQLSSQYRGLIEPLKELRRLNKSLDPNAADDILDLSAGVLAQRLRSLAPSNTQVQNALRLLDKQINKGGKTLSDTENLLDLYLTLNQYYDIAPKAGFQGRIEAAVGPVEAVMGAARNVAGKTPAVRQKALEDLLDELFSNLPKK